MKEGWEYCELKAISSFYNGNSINANYKKKHFEGLEKGFPFIATKDVSYNGKIDYDCGVKIPFNTEFKKAKPNSVLLCVEGGSAGRKIAFVEKEVCFGNKLFCLEPKSHIDGKYLYFFLLSDFFQNQFRERLTGLIGGVNSKKLGNILIGFPPLLEQKQIANYLNTAFAKIDAVKKKAKENLDNANALFKATLNEMMTPKEGWEEKKLSEIGLTQTGTTPLKSDSNNYGCFMPFIRPSEIDFDGMGGINSACDISLSEQGAKKGRVFAANSILMVCIGATIGKVGYSVSEVSCNQQINVLTPFEDYNPLFIYFAMSSQSFKNKVIKEGTSAQATLPIINKGKWEQLSLYVPKKVMQSKIANSLTAFQNKINVLKCNLAKLTSECDTFKQSLLKQVFE